MFSSTVLLALFSAASVVSAGLVPRRDPPPGWNFAVLEDYETYHIRYLALGCEYQHGKAFFDECCHPHLNYQQLSDFPAECTPSPAASSSAAAEEASSTVTTPADGNDSGVETVTITSTSGQAAPTPSTADDSDDEDDEDCDDEDDGDDDSNNNGDDSSNDSGDNNNVPTTTAEQQAPTTPTPSPTPTTSTKDAEPSSTQQTTPAPSPAAPSPSPSPSDSNSGDNSGSNVVTGGVATFFTQNGVAGACGAVHSDSDLIAAVDQDRYGDSGAVSPLCGKQVAITNTNNGKTVTVTIVDDCPTCINGNSMDLSVGAFTQIATEEEGEVPITWVFV